MDKAFDDFLMEYETFPHLEDCSSGKCSYCGKTARYALRMPDSIPDSEEEI